MIEHKHGNEFLDAYLEMVEETESPRTFHIWSACAGVSACLGRRIWLPFGHTQIFGNMFVLLVGQAAARKGTAMNIIAKILREHTGVKFAQTDCAGKRQGVISVIADDVDDPERREIDMQLQEMASLTPELLGRVNVNMGKIKPKVHDADKYCVFVASDEFTAFTGQGNSEFLMFLQQMYDGIEYDYRLRQKKERIILNTPLMTLLGCTTPTNIADALPPASIGQGFTSRIIFVFGGRKYKSIAEPTAFNAELLEFVVKRVKEIYYNLAGEIKRTGAAVDYAKDIYEKQSDLTDGRFTYYLSRRHTHFLKLCIVLAVARGSMTVDENDCILADNILIATEKTMPDALGEFGLSPVAVAKQKILEFIMFSREPVTVDMLHAFMHRDLKIHDLVNCLNDLTMAGKVQQVKSQPLDKIVYIPRANFSPETLELMDIVATNPGTETTQ